jgi:hypothetical protein
LIVERLGWALLRKTFLGEIRRRRREGENYRVLVGNKVHNHCSLAAMKHVSREAAACFDAGAEFFLGMAKSE